MNKIVKFCLTSLALIVCMTSCSQYDDTEVLESIKDLQDRVATLEAKVTENISAIQSMVTLGSVQSVTIDAETGKAVINLKDGTSVTIDCETVGYSLITVEKDSDGEYYWAICEDGEVAPLLIDGKKVPVSVTPALKLSEQNEWMISADGGKTWVSTGIFQNPGESGGDAPLPGQTVSFFQSVEYDGDYLILTLMDGKELKVQVSGEAAFAAITEKLWFAKEGIEKIALLEMNNLKAFTITEKPEGWKARIQTDSLIVTSPEDFTVSATSGVVKILGVFNEGNNPEIVSVEVLYEKPITLKAGVESAFEVVLAEHALEDIEGYVAGAWKAADFTPEALAAWLNSEEAYGVECYTESKVFDLEQMVEEYNPNEAYVVYVAEHLPVKQLITGNMAYVPEDFQLLEVGSTKMTASFSDIRYDSATFNLQFNEAMEYYGGFSELGFWEAIGRDNVLESLNHDNMTALSELSYSGDASKFPDGIEGAQILPSSSYVAWIVIAKEEGGYTADDFIQYTFTSAPIVAGGTLSAPSCEVTEVTYGGFSASITPASGAYKTYAAIRKASAIPEDELLSVAELIDINHVSVGSEILNVSSNNFSADDEVYLIAVSISEDGSFGKIHKEKVELKKLVYSDAMSVSLSSSLYGLGDVSVSMTYTGDPATVSYYCTSNAYFSDEVLQDMLAKGQLGDARNDVKISSLSGGKVELTGLSLGIEYTFYALVKDAEGNPSRMSKISFIPIILVDYVLSSSADYEYGMPQITVTKKLATYTMSVDMPDTCVQYWMFVGDYEYMSGSASSDVLVDVYGATDKLVTMQLESLGATVNTESIASQKITVRSTTRIYMAWQDDKGSYHAVHVVNPNK